MAILFISCINFAYWVIMHANTSPPPIQTIPLSLYINLYKRSQMLKSLHGIIYCGSLDWDMKEAHAPSFILIEKLDDYTTPLLPVRWGLLPITCIAPYLYYVRSLSHHHATTTIKNSLSHQPPHKLWWSRTEGGRSFDAERLSLTDHRNIFQDFVQLPSTCSFLLAWSTYVYCLNIDSMDSWETSYVYESSQE